uniref:Uncharacterized protein n=1 Tax=Arundo donax TaxID=35708 RepID=A0A0A9HKU0_ARUDO
MLSFVLFGISKHVFSSASATFFSLCITSILCRTSNLRKYGNLQKPLNSTQLCDLPNPLKVLFPMSSC